MTVSPRLYHPIVPILFGTYNRSTATAAEIELSKSLQRAFANFVKNPVNAPPAPNWAAYEPGFVGVASVPTLAEIAYQGNVGFDDFIEPVQPISKVSTRGLYSQPTRSESFIAERLFYRRMGRALFGTHFWTSAPEKSPTASENYSLRAGLVDA
jgi:hypothetical protein